MSCSPEWAQPPSSSGKGHPISLPIKVTVSVPLPWLRTAFRPTISSRPGAWAQQMGLVQQDLTPGPLPSSPFSGFRSYPLRGSHSLDDLLDRPGNFTASLEYWDNTPISQMQSRVPSRAPSPTPTPGSRRSSMGSTGVASDVKVSPLPLVCPQPWGRPVGRGTRDQVTLLCRPSPQPESVHGAGDGLLRLGWRCVCVGGKHLSQGLVSCW